MCFLCLVQLKDWRNDLSHVVHFKQPFFLQSWGKGPGPFKRGKFPKLEKKTQSERKIDNVLVEQL